jgi:hypothetical protein
MVPASECVYICLFTFNQGWNMRQRAFQAIGITSQQHSHFQILFLFVSEILSFDLFLYNHKRVKEPIKDGVFRSIVRCNLRAITCIFFSKAGHQAKVITIRTQKTERKKELLVTTVKMEEDLILLCTYLRLARQNQLLQTEGVH